VAAAFAVAAMINDAKFGGGGVAVAAILVKGFGGGGVCLPLL